MEKTTKKVLISVAGSIIIALLGYSVRGLFGLMFALAGYWTIFTLFVIFRRGEE